MAELESKLQKDFTVLGFGVKYAKGMTDEADIIRGGSLMLFGKQALTIAICNTDWVDEQGKPYGCKLDGTVLFVRKVALGIGKRGI